MSIKAQHIKLLVFLFIVIMTVYQHVSSIDQSMQNRDNIWEPDDNYHELIKASNSKNCIEETCIGLENIYRMYEENLNNRLNIYQSDVLVHHTLVEYHPIKSFLLKKLYLFFEDWESSHLFLTKIVTSFLVFLIPLFIFRYSNLNVALISSILLFPYVGIKYGFHFSNGSDELASIFSLISLICIRYINFKNIILYLIFIILCLFSHPVGIIMLSFNVLIFLFLSNFKFYKINIFFYLLNLIIIFVYFQLDFNYSQNKIILTDIYNNYDFYNLQNLINLILENIKNNLYFIYEIHNLLNIILLLFFLFLYFKYRDSQSFTLKIPTIFFITTIFFLLLSNLHYAPEASITTRMQQIFTSSILLFFSSIIFLFFKENYILYLNNNLQKKNIVICFFVLSIFSFSTFFNFQHLNLKIKSNQETLNINLDSIKIASFLESLKKEDIIIFNKGNIDNSTFKSIVYKFILEGGNNRNIFIDELMTINLYKKILNKKNYNAVYVVSVSPMITNNLSYKKKRPQCFSLTGFSKCIERGWYGKSRTYMSDLLIKDKSALIFSSVDFQNEDKYLFLLLNTYNNNVEIKSDNYNIKFNTKDKYEWIKLNYEKIQDHKIQFSFNDNTFIKLNGIKVNKNQQNYWPWKTNFEIIYEKDDYVRNFIFNEINNLNFLDCKDGKIIDDKGSYFITKINCKIK